MAATALTMTTDGCGELQPASSARGARPDHQREETLRAARVAVAALLPPAHAAAAAAVKLLYKVCHDYLDALPGLDDVAYADAARDLATANAAQAVAWASKP